ncbi:MAG: L,D-transpeptidase [Gemmatimonadaceae bacterium]
MVSRVFSYGGKTVWMLILGFITAAALSVTLLTKTAELRYQRDVNRMVYNDNLGVLDEVKASLGMTGDSLRKLMSDSPAEAANQPYLVVSIADHMLWFKRGSEVLFEAPIATGSGKELVTDGGQWRFETPRGRLSVQAKEEDPAWVPPDWHFIELAHKRGLGVVKLSSGQSIRSGDGVISVQNGQVVRRYSDGRTVSLGGGTEGREIVSGGNVIIPPFGTTARRYLGVLGTRRLKMGDGYAIHGTNKPETIGRSVSHGCVRMRNADIERLYPMVPVGTPVYIY